MALQATGKKPQEAVTSRPSSTMLPGPVGAAAKLPSTTFFDLPPEIRNVVYDMVVYANVGTSVGWPWDMDRCITIHHPPRFSARNGLPTATPALIQVNKQIRREALPRLHMIVGLCLVGPEVSLKTHPSAVPMKWRTVLGPTRVPLTRNFVISDWRCLEILLPGSPDFPKQEKKSVLVRATESLEESLEEFRLSQDEIEEMEVFIEARLKRNSAGVFLEVEDLPAMVAKVTAIAVAAAKR